MSDRVSAFLRGGSPRPPDDVIDGDTVRLDGQPARVLGVDAPEMAHGRQAYEPGATTAAEFLRAADPEFRRTGETDRYGRELVQGRAGGEDLDVKMIRAGVAQPFMGSHTPEQRQSVVQAFLRRANPAVTTEWDERMQAERDIAGFPVSFDKINSRGIEPESVASRAWDRGVANLRTSLGAAQVFLGSQIDSEWLRAAGEKRMAEGLLDAALNPATVESYEDVDGWATAGTYIAEKVVENIPGMLPMLAGGVGGAALRAGVAKAATTQAAKTVASAQLRKSIGRWAAGGAASMGYPQHMGEGALALMDSDVDLGEAKSPFLTAAVNTVLDVAPMAAVLQYSFKGLSADLAKDIIKGNAETLRKKGLWTATLAIARDMGKGAALAAPMEGVTEWTQELVNQSARAYYDPTYDLYGEEAQQQRAEAFVAGATVGGVLGGAGRGAAATYRELNELMRPEQPPASDEPPMGSDTTEPPPPGAPTDAPPADGPPPPAASTTPETPTAPEPREDIEAQVDQLVERPEPGQFRFFEGGLRGVTVPPALATVHDSDGNAYVFSRTDEAGRSAAMAARRARGTARGDAARSEGLGLQQTKDEAAANGAPAVVQGTTEDGSVVHEEAVDSTQPEVVQAAARTAEDRGASDVRVVPVEEALQRREELVAQEEDEVLPHRPDDALPPATDPGTAVNPSAYAERRAPNVFKRDGRLNQRAGKSRIAEALQASDDETIGSIGDALAEGRMTLREAVRQHDELLNPPPPAEEPVAATPPASVTPPPDEEPPTDEASSSGLPEDEQRAMLQRHEERRRRAEEQEAAAVAQHEAGQVVERELQAFLRQRLREGKPVNKMVEQEARRLIRQRHAEAELAEDQHTFDEELDAQDAPRSDGIDEADPNEDDGAGRVAEERFGINPRAKRIRLWFGSRADDTETRKVLAASAGAFADALQYTDDGVQAAAELIDRDISTRNRRVLLTVEIAPPDTRAVDASIDAVYAMAKAFTDGVKRRSNILLVYPPGATDPIPLYGPALLEAGKQFLNAQAINPEVLFTHTGRLRSLNAALLWLAERGFTLGDQRTTDLQGLIQSLKADEVKNPVLAKGTEKLPEITLLDALESTPLTARRQSFAATREEHQEHLRNLAIAVDDAELDMMAALGEFDAATTDEAREEAEEAVVEADLDLTDAERDLETGRELSDEELNDRPAFEVGTMDHSSSREHLYERQSSEEMGYSTASDSVSGEEMNRETERDQNARSRRWMRGDGKINPDDAALTGHGRASNAPATSSASTKGKAKWLEPMLNAARIALREAGLANVGFVLASAGGVADMAAAHRRTVDSLAKGDPLAEIALRNAELLEKAQAEDPPGRILWLRSVRNPGLLSPVIYLSTKSTPGKRAHALLHELGHLSMYHMMRELPKDVRTSLVKALGGNEAFNENFAELFAHWMLTESEARDQILEALVPEQSAETKTVFEKMMKTLRNLWLSLRRQFKAEIPAFSEFMYQWTGFAKGRKLPAERASGRLRRVYQALEEKYGENGIAYAVYLPARAVEVESEDFNPRRFFASARSTSSEALGGIAGFYDRHVRAEDGALRRMARDGSRAALWFADHTHRAPRAGSSIRRGMMKAEVARAEQHFFERMDSIVKEVTPGGLFSDAQPSKDLQDAAELLIREEPLSAARARKEPAARLAREARKVMEEMYEWLRTHGVYLEHRENYWTQAWDRTRVLQGRGRFMGIVEEWAQSEAAKEWWENANPGKKFSVGAARSYGEGLYRVMASHDGALAEINADPEKTTEDLEFLAPGMSSTHARRVPRELAEALEEFRDRDVVRTLHAYIRSGVRRGIWQSRFGANRDIHMLDVAFEQVRSGDMKLRDARKLKQDTLAKWASIGVDMYDPSAELKRRLLEDYRAGRLSETDYERIVRKIIPGYQGTLGAAETPSGWRRTQALAIVYQNFRLLAMGVFSQFTDPGMMAARLPKGTRSQFLAKGLKALFNKATREELRKDARALGLWHDDIADHIMNDTHGVMMASRTIHRWNERLFRMNGMSYMTNVWRAAATSAAKDLIGKWAEEGADAPLRELGITVAEARHWVAQGKPMGWVEDVAVDAVQSGLFQLVGEGILRSDAQTRPAIGNDHRFQVFWHLHSFTWQYASVILGRVWEDSKKRWGEEEGARKALAALPALALAAWTIPLAAAGMELRWLIAPTPARPEGGWDYFWEATQRSGMLGVGQMLVDLGDADAHGQFAPVAVAGPTVGHIGDFFTKDLDTVLWRSLPAYPLVRTVREAFE